MTDSTLWFLTAAVAVVALFLLSSAIVVEWDLLPPPWRRVLIAVVVEQAAITYGAVEAERYEVEPALRALVVSLSIAGVILALGVLILEHEFRRWTTRRERRDRVGR